MKIKIASFGESLILHNDTDTVDISVREGLRDLGDPPIIIDFSEEFVKFIRLRDTNTFRLMIYRDRLTYEKASKQWREMNKENKEVLEADKRSKKNWQVLFIGGKRNIEKRKEKNEKNRIALDKRGS